MKTRILQVAVVLAALVGASQIQAAEGYWDDKAADVWRSGSGECLHTNFWNADMAIVGCDGKVAEPPPAPMPVVEAAPVAPEPVAMTSAEATVNFAFDRADLDSQATAALDSLVSQAKSQGSIKAVRLTGHADRVGTEEYNLDLSLRRAGSVNDYLVERAGVSPQAIEVSGKGESEPLAACEGMRGSAALSCLAPNRRVEAVIDLF